MHQRWKRTWLGWAGIYPTTRVSVTSPNPGEQAWYLQKERLPDRPSVISLGLAENLSFDLAMVRAYRSIVHGFDPTEASQAWVANHSLPEDFHFHSLAVAGYDGWIELVERRGRGGEDSGPGLSKGAMSPPERDSAGVTLQAGGCFKNGHRGL